LNLSPQTLFFSLKFSSSSIIKSIFFFLQWLYYLRLLFQVRSDDLVDPVSRVLDKNMQEKLMLGTAADMRLAKQVHTREVLEVTDWGSGRIEATPHGCFAKMMAPKAHPREVSSTFKSLVPMDHYNVSIGKVATDSEFPMGKRMRPKLP
jgi:hypothetical protein